MPGAIARARFNESNAPTFVRTLEGFSLWGAGEERCPTEGKLARYTGVRVSRKTRGVTVMLLGSVGQLF